LNRLLSLRAEHDGEEGAVAAQQRRPAGLELLDGCTDGLIAVSADVRLGELFPGRFYQMATPQSGAGRFPVVACPAVHYAQPDDRLKYDIVQSIRTRTLLRQAHPAQAAGQPAPLPHAGGNG
jgi:hypothetical protein